LEIAEKRRQHIPLDYILGFSNFYGLNVKVDKNVLIPKMETELLVESVLKHIDAIKSVKCAKVLDLCTGSGCIAAAIASNCNEVDLILSDTDGLALNVARQNMTNLIGDKCNWSIVESDMFDNLKGLSFDIIVSNPPYVSDSELNELSVEVKAQPLIALSGGIDGLKFYRNIAENAKYFLQKNGSIFLEIGYTQGQAVSQILEEQGFCNCVIKKDFSNLDRVVSATVR
jgi:release factor glutamine methyltransferase